MPANRTLPLPVFSFSTTLQFLTVMSILLVHLLVIFTVRYLYSYSSMVFRYSSHLCHLLTLKLFQTGLNVFVLLNTKEDILKNVGNRAVMGHN